jgi:hypothetical protein
MNDSVGAGAGVGILFMLMTAAVVYALFYRYNPSRGTMKRDLIAPKATKKRADKFATNNPLLNKRRHTSPSLPLSPRKKVSTPLPLHN